jgi:hypothetical protein
MPEVALILHQVTRQSLGIHPHHLSSPMHSPCTLLPQVDVRLGEAVDLLSKWSVEREGQIELLFLDGTPKVGMAALYAVAYGCVPNWQVSLKAVITPHEVLMCAQWYHLLRRRHSGT